MKSDKIKQKPKVRKMIDKELKLRGVPDILRGTDGERITDKKTWEENEEAEGAFVPS